jgi:hypothetical protein
VLTLLWLAGVFDPPLSELDRFPVRCTAEEQRDRCSEHIGRLRALRGVHGWQGGFWDDCIRETERHQRYWLLLFEAHDQFALPDRLRRNRLAQLRAFLGEQRWRAGWRPPLIPDASAFEPPLPMKPADNP